MFPFAQPRSTVVAAAATTAWNPDDKAPEVTLSNNNLTAATSGFGNYNARGTTFRSAGQWYAEIRADAIGAGLRLGVASAAASLTSSQFGDGPADSTVYTSSGTVRYNGQNVASVASYTTGDVIGIALDATARTLTFFKNGTQVAQTSSIPTGALALGFNGLGTTRATLNAGQSPFVYAVPSGFSAWG